MTDYGMRSACCLAAIKVGKVKVKKTNQVRHVWVCVVCKTKDCKLITASEASQIRNKNPLKIDIDDDKGFQD